MRSIEQAEKIASTYLRSLESDGVELALLHELSQEFDAGWVFPYQSESFIQSANFSDSLVGNAPIFVPRLDGSATTISYLRPYAESIAAFVACGNIDSELIAEVALICWSPGALTVKAIQLIRNHSNLGLASAKKAVDDCLASKSTRVQTTSVMAAQELVVELSQVGFTAELVWGG